MKKIFVAFLLTALLSVVGCAAEPGSPEPVAPESPSADSAVASDNEDLEPSANDELDKYLDTDAIYWEINPAYKVGEPCGGDFG